MSRLLIPFQETKNIRFYSFILKERFAGKYGLTSGFKNVEYLQSVPHKFVETNFVHFASALYDEDQCRCTGQNGDCGGQGCACPGTS